MGETWARSVMGGVRGFLPDEGQTGGILPPVTPRL